MHVRTNAITLLNAYLLRSRGQPSHVIRWTRDYPLGATPSELIFPIANIPIETEVNYLTFFVVYNWHMIDIVYGKMCIVLTIFLIFIVLNMYFTLICTYMYFT